MLKRLSLHQKGILALILANLIWGIAPPIYKFTFQNIPPFTHAFLRFFGAMLLLYPFCAGNLIVKLRDWPKLIIMSVAAITINIGTLYLGLERAPSINAPIVASSGPVFMYLFSIFFLHEKASWRVLIGTIISLLGVSVIIGQPIAQGTTGNGEILGNVLFIIATLAAGVGIILVKDLLKRYSATTLTFWSFLIGCLTFLPFFIHEQVMYHPFATIDYRGWIGIYYGILGSSLIAYWANNWAIGAVKVQEIGIFVYLDPIATALVAIPLLGETITPIFLLGSLLVFGGIYAAEGRLPYHPINRLRRSILPADPPKA